MYLFAGKTSDAQPYIRTLLELDPLTSQNHVLPGWALAVDGQFQEAIDAGFVWSEIDPANPILGWVCVSVLTRLGRRDEALTTFARIRTLAPGSVFDGLSRFYEAVLHEKRLEARAAIAPYTERAWWDFQYSWEVASGYALLGEMDEALRWLRNAVDRGFFNYPFLNDYDPFLENLRSDQRFQELMEYTRERWESFDA